MLRTAGAGQIDLQCGVDRDHPVVAGDDGRIVHIVDRTGLHVAIAVEKVVGGPRPHAEGEHPLAGMQGLARICDDPLLHQLDQPRREHFSVQTEIAPVSQSRADRVRQGADTHLKGRAVLDHLGDQPADGEVIGRRCDQGQFKQGYGVLDHRRHPRNMDRAVAEDPRHGRVDLEDDPPGVLADRPVVVSVDPEAEEAVVVHRRDGADQGVDPGLPHQPRNLLETGGDEGHRIGPSGRPRPRFQPPLDGAVEQAHRADPAHQLVPEHRPAGDAGGQQIVEADVVDLPGRGPFGQCCENGWRLGKSESHRHTGARRNEGDGVGRRHQTLGVQCIRHGRFHRGS